MQMHNDVTKEAYAYLNKHLPRLYTDKYFEKYNECKTESKELLIRAVRQRRANDSEILLRLVELAKDNEVHKKNIEKILTK